MTATFVAQQVWFRICDYAQLLPDRGVAALLPDGTQIAVFRLGDGSVHVLGQRDPFSGANVMARGIVGSRGEVDTVASPMLKQEFDLRTGIALDGEGVRIPHFEAAIIDDQVHVRIDGGSP